MGDITEQANRSILDAQQELANYSQEMNEETQNDIDARKSDLEVVLDTGDDTQIQAAINALVEALDWYEGASTSGGETGRLVSKANNLIIKAWEIIDNYGADLEPSVIANLTNKAIFLQDSIGAGGDSEITAASDDLSTALDDLPVFTPENTASIWIECSAEATLGDILECGSRHDRLPDQITWSAPHGNPTSGSGDRFQTVFNMLGSYSVSVEACVGSICVGDTHTVNVIPQPEPEKSSMPSS